MKRLVTIFWAFAIAIAVYGQSFGVKTLWEKTEVSFNKADLCRGIGYAQVGEAKHLYLAARAAVGVESSVVVLDAVTGDSIKQLSNTGFSGGTHILSTLAVSADNVILACNLTTDARLKDEANNPFKVYAWTSEVAEPQVVLEYNTPANDDFASRYGDKIIVTGNYMDGTAKLYVSNWFVQPNGGEVAIFSMKEDPANAGVHIFDPVPVRKYFNVDKTGGLATNMSSYVERPDGSFLWTANYPSPIRNYNKEGVFINTSPDLMATTTNGLKYLGSDGIYEYIAFIKYATANASGTITDQSGCAEVYKYPIGDFANVGRAYLVAKTNPTDATTNGNGAGDIAIDFSGKHPTLYTVLTNQSIGAYELTSVSFAPYAPDNTENTTILWERNDKVSGIPDYFGALRSWDNNSIAYSSQDIAIGTIGGEKTLYLLTVKELNIHLINPATGEDIGELILPETSLLEQGVAKLWSMATTEDGKLLVANKASANTKFNVYLYNANDAQPEVALSYSVPATVNGELGNQKIDVIGSYGEGTAKLYVSTDGDYGTEDNIKIRVYVFSMKAEGDGFVFDNLPTVVEFEPGPISPEANKWAFHNLAVAANPDGTFYWMGTYYPVMHYDMDGNRLSAGDTDILTQRGNAPKYIGKDENGKEYLTYYSYRENDNEMPAGRAEVYAYSGKLYQEAEIFAKTTSMGQLLEAPENIQADGAIAIDRTGDKIVLYVLSSNQGIGAYGLDLKLSTSDGKEGILTKSVDLIRIYQQNDKLVVSGAEVRSIELISIMGQTVKQVKNQPEINITGLTGVYLLKIKTIFGETKVEKTAIR